MALLVHVTAEKNAARIRRAGISARSFSDSTDHRGVFCGPLMSSPTLTYQWSRELLRRGDRTVAAVRFQAPDDAEVFVGRYGTAQERLPLTAAIARFRAADDPLGWEIFLPGAVAAGAIRGIRILDRPVGWRYRPGAHGRRLCACPVCLRRGEYGSARIRRRQLTTRRQRNEVLAELQEARSVQDTVNLLQELAAGDKGDAHRIAHLADHPDPAVREELAFLLGGGFRGEVAAALLRQLSADPVAAVREAAAD